MNPKVTAVAILALLVLAGVLLDAWLFPRGTLDENPIVLENVEISEPDTAIVSIGGISAEKLPRRDLDEIVVEHVEPDGMGDRAEPAPDASVAEEAES